MMPKAAASAADAVCLDLEDAVVPGREGGGPRPRRPRAAHARLRRPHAHRPHQRRRHALRLPRSRGGDRRRRRPGRSGDAAQGGRARATWCSWTCCCRRSRRIAGSAAPSASRPRSRAPQGYVNLREIAAASPRLEALIFGPGDYAASMRMPSSGIGELDAHDELYPGHRWHAAMHGIVAAARANGLRCLDGPYSAYKDAAGFERACRIARAMGFDGKQCIHPGQLATANAAVLAERRRDRGRRRAGARPSTPPWRPATAPPPTTAA